MHKVSALFVRADSIYADLLFDVWDAERDARRYAGPWPVVAHPPCRGWGKLRKLAKPRADEHELAFFAVDFVRQFGGVLEHPYGSDLWDAACLPRPGQFDEYGGWTVLVDQGWWGHHAPKPTWLYVVGMPRHHLDGLPVESLRRKGRTLDMLPADRERTPRLFAEFLVRLAARCYVRPGRAVTPVDRARLPAAPVRGYVDLAARETCGRSLVLRRPGASCYPELRERVALLRGAV